jgi:hypothetical protein
VARLSGVSAWVQGEQGGGQMLEAQGGGTDVFWVWSIVMHPCGSSVGLSSIPAGWLQAHALCAGPPPASPPPTPPAVLQDG